jgi:T-complex protein 1 subunit delta
VKAYGEALESIPYTLAENAGLDPIEYVTELRNRHIKGEKYSGLNLKKNTIADMYEANVIQPSLVSTSAITLATECVRMILKIDDIVISR